MSKNSYTTLSTLSIKDKIERKGKLDYISWANAWHMLKSNYPNAQRKIYESQSTELNYFTDGNTAYVKVGIEVDGLEHIDYLPIMDFRNNSIALDKVTSMDVNKAIQRSTAKAIAMHGLGLSLWAGEDLVGISEEAPAVKATKKPTLKKTSEKWDDVVNYVKSNNSKPLSTIIKTLETRYTIPATIKKELGKYVK